MRIRVAYLDRDVRRLADELRRAVGPAATRTRAAPAERDTKADRQAPAEPAGIDRRAEHRARMTTIELAIERHGDRASAGELRAWREELAALQEEGTE